MLEPHPPAWLWDDAGAWSPEVAVTEAADAAAQLQLTGLRAGMDARDVGGGSGAVTRVMSTIIGPGRVTGVDPDPRRVAAARTLATVRGIEIEFLVGEATALPLPAASFDYTWARLGAAGLAQRAPTLAELVRVTRPGGSVVVGGLDGQFAPFQPRAAALHSELGEARRRLEASGGDPWVGRKLYGWCYQGGLRELTAHILPCQVVTGGVPGDERAHWRAHLETGMQRLIEYTGKRARWEQFPTALPAELQRPALFYYSRLILVRGIVPGAQGSQAGPGY